MYCHHHFTSQCGVTVIYIIITNVCNWKISGNMCCGRGLGDVSLYLRERSTHNQPRVNYETTLGTKSKVAALKEEQKHSQLEIQKLVDLSDEGKLNIDSGETTEKTDKSLVPE